MTPAFMGKAIIEERGVACFRELKRLAIAEHHTAATNQIVQQKMEDVMPAAMRVKGQVGMRAERRNAGVFDA